MNKFISKYKIETYATELIYLQKPNTSQKKTNNVHMCPGRPTGQKAHANWRVGFYHNLSLLKRGILYIFAQLVDADVKYLYL